MSELKAYIAYEADDFPDETEFYLKTEADAYISALDNCHKYKRCLDKATICLRNTHLCIEYVWPRRKFGFWKKWELKWLKLAEKFKEGK